MVLELHAIEKSCLRTSGGIKQIVLVDPDDLVAQPAWYVVPNIEALDFLPGKAAYAFQHTRFSATLTDETPTDAQAGDYFTYRLTAFIRIIRGEVELLRAKLQNRRIHVIVTYMDGSQRFLPFIRLAGKGDSGARYGKDAPGVTFTGVVRLTRPAPFLDGDFNIIGGPYVPPEGGGTGAVEAVDIVTTDPTYTYTIASGKWMVGWELVSDTEQTVSLGLSALGDELGGPIPLEPNQIWVGDGNMLQTFTSTNIYFSGMQGENTIRIWLLG